MTDLIQRRFEDSTYTEVITTILSDIVRTGKSEGWSTNNVLIKQAVDSTLQKYNVYYTDDMRGTYERKQINQEFNHD